jgi:hypothetical protein
VNLAPRGSSSQMGRRIEEDWGCRKREGVNEERVEQSEAGGRV